MPGSPTILLVDNGSLQPAATLSLRRVAADLSARIGQPVAPVSLLHSSTIDGADIGGEPAEILEPAIRRRHAAGSREFLLVPLFFGPSAALTDYIPERMRALAADLPGLKVRVAAPLVAPGSTGDVRLARILADHVRQTIARRHLHRPWVIMVDHGSPQPAVGAVRDGLARQLAEDLGPIAISVVAASMERREGAAYDFNEPLLERALRGVSGEGVIALLFFSPGRHAGPGGDIVDICADAERRCPGLRAHLTPLVAEHPGLVEILAERLQSALSDA